jgi:dihydroorotase
MDTLISNGTIVTAERRFQASIGIKDGLIAGVFEKGAEPKAREVIDAAGLHVLPGFIDMHSHHREGSQKPGFEYKETILTATQQCAAGGITTTVGMPNVQPPPNTLELLEKQYECYRKSSIVGWNFNPLTTKIDEMPAMAKTGIAGFKLFMVADTGRGYPHMPGLGVHEAGKILQTMQMCKEIDMPLMVHPHNQSLMETIEREFWARGERDAKAYARCFASYDGINHETAIALLLRLQKATGCHLHVLHMHTTGSVELIRQAKAAGQNVTCEINPWTLYLSCDWATIERLGSYALAYWVPEKNLPSLWEGIRDGTIDIVSTDHSPHTREEKELGWTDGWKAHTGLPSTQFYMSMVLSSALEGKFSLERAVEICSAAPAGIFGLERKGQILPGFDADLVLVDLHREFEVQEKDVLALVGWSPWAGRKFKGKPVRTLVRGETVYADGKVVGKPGGGRQTKATREARVPRPGVKQ